MIDREEIEKILAFAGGIKAVVVGDTMLDQYIYGTVDRISPEAPVPIVRHHHTETKAGGAANVALNLAAWGCHTTLIGLTGADRHQQTLKGILQDHGIHHCLVESTDRPTTIKTRVVAAAHHLLRIDEESSEYLSGISEQSVLDAVEQRLSKETIDLLILQDYNKGFLTPAMISMLIEIGKAKNAFIAVDPKERNFFTYRNFDLLKPNLREAGQAANRGLKVSDLSDLAKTWRNDQNIEHVAITLGSEGVFLQNNSGETQVKPDRSIDVVDVCGAGDAVVCSLAISLMGGLDLQKTGSLANLTGAYVCSHSGVVSVDPVAIMNWLKAEMSS